jgi:hypothetical protein
MPQVWCGRRQLLVGGIDLLGHGASREQPFTHHDERTSGRGIGSFNRKNFSLGHELIKPTGPANVWYRAWLCENASHDLILAI